jgi:DNA-directed RNA polymerase specialized sigma24 family protein
METASAFNPTRTAELFGKFAPTLQVVLCCSYPRIDPQHVADAVVDAIIRVACSEHDTSFEELLRIARSRLRTGYRSELRRQRREHKVGVKHANATRTTTTLDELVQQERHAGCREKLTRTDEERAIFDLLLIGQKNSTQIAELTGLNEDRVVKILNRLRQRISRYSNAVRAKHDR